MKTSQIIGIVFAVMIIAALFLASNTQAQDCQGNSCKPLPTQSEACEGPAAWHNPHCIGQDEGEEEQTPTPIATATPRATNPTGVEKTPEPTACTAGKCPDPACSLATIAAAQSTIAAVQAQLLNLQLTQMAP